MIHAELLDDGLLLARLDHPGKANVFDAALGEAFAALVERVCSAEDVRGLILASAKPDFLLGADIELLRTLDSAPKAFEATMAFKAELRRLERCGKPVVAIVNGQALGAGFEIALACHARIGLADTVLALPEVRLGLLPAGGGTQRLPRLVGQATALPWLLEGTRIRAAQAQESGLLEAVAASAEDALALARAWALAHLQPEQPWDRKGWRYPGGGSARQGELWAIAPSMASDKGGTQLPNITHILSCVFEGGLLGMDAALELESRYFAACATSAPARALLGLWLEQREVQHGAARPAVPVHRVHRLGVIGAGMMGAGIAHVAAKAGIEVVLLDSQQALAERGKAHAEQQLKRLPEAERQAVLARIEPTTNFVALRGCDLVIEAVFEQRSVKTEVIHKAEAHLDVDTVFGSNTSTLPIGSLAQASSAPERFVGIHFFSPVEKMPLVEIIRGPRTGEAALALAFDLTRQLGKTAIVVNDGRGFYTSRCFGTYLLEACAMVLEGVPAAVVEAAGRHAGMPMPPLALHDEVSLSLTLAVDAQTRTDLGAAAPAPHPGLALVQELVAAGRVGRKAGQGFYDYEGGKKLWAGLARHAKPASWDLDELAQRLLDVQMLEALRCLHEGVLGSVAEGNVGAVLGWGFAPHTGGTLQAVQAQGLAAFLQRCAGRAARLGARWQPESGLAQLPL
ncbi:MAG: 3-hydroxyacyl-CoA dehydrogenase NAD-binding domain-containing protein [Inhella sp.]